MSSKQKVLVIGLDGVPFGLIRKWADAGRLPNIARLLDHGPAGDLRSTMPPRPESPPRGRLIVYFVFSFY